ncbi:MAG: hypothetical protein EPO67_00640 [Reyranella sp.]|jgi:hypothetical protein|nr:MAG: hypothetical protein EPO67_00640 [Reyranella sp.]
MRKLCISVVIGGLAMMPLSAMSQNMASAPNAAPKADHMLFVENGNKVPASAMGTVRSAAEAAKEQKTVRVEGRADAANAVKQELVKQGAPADKISVRPVAAKPLMKVGDGLSDPTERKVEIKY